MTDNEFDSTGKMKRRTVLGTIGGTAAASMLPQGVLAKDETPATNLRIATTSFKFDLDLERPPTGYRSVYSRHRLLDGNLFALNPIKDGQFNKLRAAESLVVEDGKYHETPHRVVEDSVDRIYVGPHDRSSYTEPVTLEQPLSVPTVQLSDSSDGLRVEIDDREVDVQRGEFTQIDVDVPNLTQDHLAIDIEGDAVQTSAKLSVSYHGAVDVYDMRGEEWVTELDL